MSVVAVLKKMVSLRDKCLQCSNKKKGLDKQMLFKATFEKLQKLAIVQDFVANNAEHLHLKDGEGMKMSHCGAAFFRLSDYCIGVKYPDNTVKLGRYCLLKDVDNLDILLILALKKELL